MVGGNRCRGTRTARSRHGVLIENSGEVMCYLVFGGAWGLPLREAGTEWDVADTRQWGEPFLLLGGDGADLKFA